MEKKMKKTRRGAIVFAACLIAGVAFCVSAEPLKEKDSSISKKKAVEIALTHAGLKEEEITKLQTERDQKEGRDIYEITFQTEEREYEYNICTQDGVISKMQFEVKEGQNSQDKNAAKLTEEEAKKIALKMVEGAEEEDIRIEKDEDDGVSVYDGKIIYEDIKYEFEMDAVSGELLNWEQESVLN